MNKFEQVSIRDHHTCQWQGVGLGGLGGDWGSQCFMSGGGLYSEVQCIMGDGHRGPP